MKCKNCGEEFEKGKFCPECSFPVEGEPNDSQKAMSMLEKIDKRTEALENKVKEREAKEQEEKENADKDKDKQNAGKPKPRGVFDIF